MYGSSYSSRDGNKGVGFPSIILDGVILWVIFGVLMCEGLFMKSIMAVCGFDELDCVAGGW